MGLDTLDVSPYLTVVMYCQFGTCDVHLFYGGGASYDGIVGWKAGRTSFGQRIKTERLLGPFRPFSRRDSLVRNSFALLFPFLVVRASMARNAKVRLGSRVVHMRQTNASARSKSHGHATPRNSRARVGLADARLPFLPPEDWHEPADESDSYSIIVQDPGAGYRHVVTRDEVIARLSELPAEFLRPLQFLQLSRMTRKKQSFPCYGMQWGATIYLYPMEESLTESYHWPPKPSQVVEAEMYGGRWINTGGSSWSLIWTEEAIKDFYLNNILIHELGHLLDNRNRG